MRVDLVTEFIQFHLQGKIIEFRYSFGICDPFLQEFYGSCCQDNRNAHQYTFIEIGFFTFLLNILYPEIPEEVFKTIAYYIQSGDSHNDQQNEISDIPCFKEELWHQHIYIDVHHRNQDSIYKKQNIVLIKSGIPMPEPGAVHQEEKENQE